MKKEIPSIDLEILKECCNELNIELIPSSCDDCVVLIDENGNKDYLDCGFNIFDDFEGDTLLNEPYFVGNEDYVSSKQVKTVNEYDNIFEYNESPSIVYNMEINSYIFNELKVA